MKKRIAAFNWKLLPTTLEEFNTTHRKLKALAKKYTDTKVIFAPPVSLTAYKHTTDGALKRSSQTLSPFESGAHTAEISPLILKELDIAYTIVGHSEERAERGLVDEDISKRVALALQHRLTPIVCFGEYTRDGRGRYTEILEEQIKAVFESLPDAQKKRVVLAYEPIWAIGDHATRPITSEELFSTIILIKNILHRRYGQSVSKKVSILYGGSVKDHNAQELANVSGVDGFLVGGASHKIEMLEPIISALS